MIPIPLCARDSAQELKQALKTSRDAEQKVRIRAIIAIKEGVAKKEIAKRFLLSRTSVVAWVTAYNEGGVEALVMRKGGRPEGNPKWDASVFEALASEIDKGGYWSIPRMKAWLKDHHDQAIPEQTVWYRMDKLKYSYKSARPHPVQGDKERQESFKKGASSHFSHR